MRTTDQNKNNRVAILTTCSESWGGSEELWYKTVPPLQAQGMEVLLIKERIDPAHERFAALRNSGVRLLQLNVASIKDSGVRMGRKIWRKFRPGSMPHPLHRVFRKHLQRYRPRLVIISQGINFDGLAYAHICLTMRIPYVVICHKAVEFYWPPQSDRAFMKAALQGARQCFFVSRHNRQLTEEQFGIRLANAEVIRNPVPIARQLVPYPEQDDVLYLACIGRLFIIDKGQDMLLRILSMDQWKQRPVHVSLVGSGTDEEGLRAMAALLQLKNITFTGQVNDMQEIWRKHHALVLASRSEGLPLVVIEAMAVGRPVIATNAGGTGEVVTDGVTGFLGGTELCSFEQTLERAWQRRHEWKAMGQRAFDYIAQHIPAAPETDFVNRIIRITHEG